MRYQFVIDRLDDWIVDRSGRVVAAFLLLTAVFAVGLGNVETEAGTEQFAEAVPAQDALEDVDREFEPAFGPDTGSTQLIQTGENVVSKRGLLRMLTALDRIEEREDLRVADTRSVAQLVAGELAPNATTLDRQRLVLRRAPAGRVERAVREVAAENPAVAALLSEDFNRRDATASATVAVVEHEVPAGVVEGGAGAGGGESPLSPLQLRTKQVVDSVGGDVRVFGAGIVEAEFANVIGDTLLVVVPASSLLILLFLVVAYRDLVDLLLGVTALVMALVWTFGFMGLADIPFNQILVAVPPLLLAVGIDYGIHAINRYREERLTEPDVGTAMRRTTDQLLVAFFVVTTTSVVGFASNLVSNLLPIRDFGLVAALGIVFTALVFGVFVPAAKVWLDRLRERTPIPAGRQRPLAPRGSVLDRSLGAGLVVARRAPAVFLVVVLVAGAGAAGYATGLDTTFDQEQFLPPEETPPYLAALPEPFRPSEYTVTRDINFLEERFETGESQEVIVYVEGAVQRDTFLETLHRVGDDPPDTFVRRDGRASADSVLSVVQAEAARDPEFRRLVARNDRNGNGVPDENLERVYDALLASPARDRALTFLSADRRSARVVYAVAADAPRDAVTRDARAVAGRFRGSAVATGEIVVFQAVADLILRSALFSLGVALAGTAVLLVLAYWVLLGEPTLGVANLVPIVVAVAALAGTMRLLGIALNAFTATVLAITIGLGIDYSVHVTHRFADELAERDASAALDRTVRGTGGALFGSVLTTAGGIGVLVFSVFPAIGQFGVLTALSVVYSFLATMLVLPAALVLWSRLVGPRDAAG